MTNSIVVLINQQPIVDADDTDEKAIVTTLRLFADSVEKFGVRHTMRVMGQDRKLEEALFVEAVCDHHALSTVTG